jgi:hypothetical protein
VSKDGAFAKRTGGRLDSFGKKRHTSTTDAAGAQSTETHALRKLVVMPSPPEASKIPDHRLSIEKRSDGVIVVRVRSEGPEESRLPDAVFSFRNGDPQYAYWLSRIAASSADKP